MLACCVGTYNLLMPISSASGPLPLRILFVEDNEFLRDMTVELLERPEREIVSCGTAEEALAAFENQPFDVVITDVSLPEMSGIDLAKHLLKLAPALWIVLCSGYRLDIGLDKLGPHVRALPKPFETDHIDTLLLEVRN
jgi:two-component system cell cycle response regulator CpdR